MLMLFEDRVRDMELIKESYHKERMFDEDLFEFSQPQLHESFSEQEVASYLSRLRKRCRKVEERQMSQDQFDELEDLIKRLDTLEYGLSAKGTMEALEEIEKDIEEFEFFGETLH